MLGFALGVPFTLASLCLKMHFMPIMCLFTDVQFFYQVHAYIKASQGAGIALYPGMTWTSGYGFNYLLFYILYFSLFYSLYLGSQSLMWCFLPPPPYGGEKDDLLFSTVVDDLG